MGKKHYKKVGVSRKSGLFPKEQTEKEKALLKNKTILSGLAPNFKRGKAVFERNTLKIVEIDVFGDELLHLRTGCEVRQIQAFRFQGTEEILHGRIVIWAARTRHRGRNVVCLC